jgi:cation diffusion facilitator family transporter
MNETISKTDITKKNHPAVDNENACRPVSAAHSHDGSHHHAVWEDTPGSRLLITLGLNFIIPVVQVIGGLAAGSIALISDATHNFSDFTAILISYIALKIGRKGASLQNTFGYRRAEILAAMLNAAILFAASGFIVHGAFQRLGTPEMVSGGIVVWIAGVGVIGNGFSAWLLHRDAKDSLNVRGAFLHMMGDMLTSIVVVINGLILIYRPWYWLDPLLSLLIVVFILKNCWGIIKESTAILMNATPGDLNIQAVQDFLHHFPEISGVHYLHAWSLGSSGVAFSCHVVVQDQPVSQTRELQNKIADALFHEFGIDHPVLQFETKACGNGNILCEHSCTLDNPSQPTGYGADPGKIQPLPEKAVTRYLALAARLTMAGVFIYASFDKILHPAAFAEAVYNYQLLPDVLINLSALILPWFELTLGVLLLLGIWMPGSVLGINLLMVTFLTALIINKIRGLNISCGCFSTEPTAGGLSVWVVLRDVLFFVISLYLFVYHFFRREK